MDTKHPKRYTPTEAATVIGISPNSLRNWCASFKDHLSEGATPAPGTDRILTDRDIGILQRVKELRAEHRTYDYIKTELATMPPGEAIEPYIDVQATVKPVEAPQLPTAPTLHADVLMALQSLADERFSQLQQRVTDMETGQSDRLQWFMFGIVAGILLVGVVAAIVLVGAMMR